MSLKANILDRMEFIGNEILNNRDGLIAILVAQNINSMDYYYYIISDEKNNLKVKHAIIPSKCKVEEEYDKKFNKGIMNLNGSDEMLNIHLFDSYHSDIAKTVIDENINSKKDSQCFFCFFPGADSNVLSFSLKTNNTKYIPFYELMNYLLLYSKVEKNKLFELENDVYKKTNRYKALELEKEIVEFMKKYETGRKISFEFKLNKEWKNTDFQKRAEELCEKMTNDELLFIVLHTEYLYQIVDISKYIHKIELNYDNIIYNHPDDISRIYLDLLEQKNYILSLGLNDYYTKIFIEDVQIEYYLNLLLNVMPNNQIIKISTLFPNELDKIEVLGNLKKGIYKEYSVITPHLSEGFKSSFNPVIIERGINYYKDNKVRLEIIDDLKQYTAKVVGNDDNVYDITVDLDLSENSGHFECNCPCDFLCKHIYATLLEIDEASNVASKVFDKYYSELDKKIKELVKIDDYKSEHYKDQCKKLIAFIESCVNNELDNYNDYYKNNISKIIAKTCFFILDNRRSN